MEFRIFLTNLGKYNEGELVGKWLDLPCAALETELAEIGVAPGTQYEEYFITDYENEVGYEVHEYENVWELNELAERLDGVRDVDWLLAYMDVTGEELDTAIDNYEERSSFYPNQTLEDVAYDLVNDCYNLPEIALRYFDYEAFARDLGYDGYTETDDGVICVC